MTAGSTFTGLIAWNTSTPGSSSVDLGAIDDYKPGKKVQLDPFEYPDTDARDQEYGDFYGSVKTIDISGTYIPEDGSWATLLEWKERFEALVNGFTYDAAINLYLYVYIPDYYGTDLHLWVERLEAPLLETDGSTVDLNQVNSRPGQNDASNAPIVITIESLEITLKGGTSPVAEYQVSVKQRVAA